MANSLRKAHEALDEMVAENQRLGLYDDKPPVKTYCGGKPNYCTLEETFTLDRGCYERGCVAYDERDGDGVNILGKCVDETAKGEHDHLRYATKKVGRKWVGLTR